MTQRDDYVAALLTKIGYKYSQGPTRCTGVDGYFDCSGFAGWGLNQVGDPYPCTNSYTDAVNLRLTNRIIPSAAQARATKGAWCIHGANGGEGQGGSGAPNDGHIAISLGDGRTAEAFDTAEGVIIGSFDNRGESWDRFGYPPGLNGFTQSPSPNPGPGNPQEARDMGMTGEKMVPGAKPQPKAPWLGRRAFIAAILQPNLTTDLVGFNGARFTKVGAKPIVHAMGMSIVHMGHLNGTIEDFDVVDPNVRTMVALATDGGTFDLDVTIDYL